MPAPPSHRLRTGALPRAVPSGAPILDFVSDSFPTDDLPVAVFLAWRDALFGQRAGEGRLEPVPYRLEPKGDAQDDPLDRSLGARLRAATPAAVDVQMGGKNDSPDHAVFHRDRLVRRLATSPPTVDEPARPDEIIGVEVKKLERTAAGNVPRRSGIDYNSTPPCDRILLRAAGRDLWVPGWYLFVLQEAVPGEEGLYAASALVLCDGALLNEDVDLYRSRVGTRTKSIGLGTYGDGADRERPMMLFANPLAHGEFDGKATLIHRAHDLAERHADLVHVAPLVRRAKDGTPRRFHCYRRRGDLAGLLRAPYGDFPRPERSTATAPRGRLEVTMPELEEREGAAGLL